MDDSDDEFDKELERCVYDLVALDQKACARTQLCDANALLHKFLIPMSLPWTYPVDARSATAAYDIEDLPGCRMDHDGPTSVPVVPFAGTVPHVTRSQHDPGVLELSLPSNAKRATTLLEDSTWATLPQDYEPGVPGELALHLYNETHSAKRLKVGGKSDEPEPLQLSIRFGTVSSRSKILQDKMGKGRPLLLTAQLPRVSREGHRRRGCEQAVTEALALGSYNCRVIPPGAMVKDPKLAERLWLGRTRLIWSEKDPPKEGTNRSPYRSLLTKQKYPLESLRRPENIKVAIRLNGEIVSHKDPGEQDKMSIENGDFLSLVDEALGGGADTDDDKGSVAPEPPEEPKVEQYRLNHEKLFIASKSFSGYVGSSLERIRELFTVMSCQANGEQSSASSLTVLPPVMDCIPSEEGLVSTVCTVPGTIQFRDVNSTKDCNKIALHHQRCIICWQSTEAIGSFGPVVRCSRCNIRAHRFCTGIDNADASKWVCSTCSNDDTDRDCSLCGMNGGVVQNNNGIWTHDVCRIWCEAGALDRQEDEEEHVCIFCHTVTGRLVSCVGDRCSAQFHPHCAVLSRACAQIHHKGKAEDDAFLCTQPTLSLMEVSTWTASSPRHKRTRNKTTLPVAFCGYHNPKRDAMFSGLYPDALFIKDALRIPPARERAVVVEDTS